jgi:uncharacterized repeat protein (TIGR04076 family)
MEENNRLCLHVDFSEIKSHADYRKFWDKIPRVEIRMIEQNEECQHKLGDSFIYENPYRRPANVCSALLHVLDLYIWRAALGFPSWNGEDRSVFLIHCPDRKGTVWEMRRFDE